MTALCYVCILLAAVYRVMDTKDKLSILKVKWIFTVIQVEK